jgi:hypothetical protein
MSGATGAPDLAAMEAAGAYVLIQEIVNDTGKLALS